jgi:hypothetical protein
MYESRTVEVTDVGRIEMQRSPAQGISATIVVRATEVTARVEPTGAVNVAVARDGATIWQYELSPVQDSPVGLTELVRAAETRLNGGEPVPERRRPGRPPKPRLPVPKRPTTLADIAKQPQ